MQHATTDVRDERAVVRGDEDRRAAGIDVAEQVHDLERQVGVEITSRLVGKHHVRLIDERPGDGDALLLAARQLRRYAIARCCKPTHLST